MTAFKNLDKLGEHGVKIYALFGAGASGKGTRAECIEKALVPTDPDIPSEQIAKVYVLTTSKEIDDHVKNQTKLGLKFLEAGRNQANMGMMPDQCVLEMIELRINEEYHSSGATLFLLDSAPRTVGQVQPFLNFRQVRFAGTHFIVSEATAYAGAESRRKDCLAFNLPVRDEDRIENVPKRWSKYANDTIPAINLLKQHNPNLVQELPEHLNIREHVVRTLKNMRARGFITGRHFQEAMGNLSRQKHPATEKIRAIVAKDSMSGSRMTVEPRHNQSLRLFPRPAYSTSRATVSA